MIDNQKKDFIFSWLELKNLCFLGLIFLVRNMIISNHACLKHVYPTAQSIMELHTCRTEKHIHIQEIKKICQYMVTIQDET